MENLTNPEKKCRVWEKFEPNYSHLKDFCKIELQGIDDNSMYFHLKFVLDENTYITAQSDCGPNNIIYAFRFITIIDGLPTSVEIYEDLVSPIIIGYSTNKEVVELALTTLEKIRSHTRQLEMYTNDYISNLLIGNSVKDLTKAFINELIITEKLIEFMQKPKST